MEKEVTERSRRNLTLIERTNLIVFLLMHSENEVPIYGAIAAAAKRFSCHRATVWRIWQRRESTKTPSNLIGDTECKIASQSGRKGYDLDVLSKKILSISIEKRRTIRDFACALGVSSTVIKRLLALRVIRRHSNRIRPSLTDFNKIQRLQFVMSFIDDESLKFHDMFDVVHIDEKWFNRTSDKRPLYILDGEEEPHRTEKSKRFIEKTMFLAAVARPR